MAFDSSFEKLSHSQTGSQIAIWNEAKSWSGPLRYYSRLSMALRSSAGGDSDRRLLFFRWEVEALIEKRRLEFASTFELLNFIFFQDLGFKCAPSCAAVPTLETVLGRRSGPPGLIAILYSWIAEILVATCEEKNIRCDFSRIELVHATPTEVVRVIPLQDRGEVRLVDLSQGAQAIDEVLWSEWCSSVPASGGFQRMSWAQAMIRSLTDLFHSFDAAASPTVESLTAQLFVLDQIMSLQPSETRRWADRARLNARRGDNCGALDDLKRFFAFHDRETAPAPIVALYDTLRV